MPWAATASSTSRWPGLITLRISLRGTVRWMTGHGARDDAGFPAPAPPAIEEITMIETPQIIRTAALPLAQGWPGRPRASRRPAAVVLLFHGLAVGSGARRRRSPSSSGPGLRPFKAATRVRIPLGILHNCPKISALLGTARLSLDACGNRVETAGGTEHFTSQRRSRASGLRSRSPKTQPYDGLDERRSPGSSPSVRGEGGQSMRLRWFLDAPHQVRRRHLQGAREATDVQQGRIPLAQFHHADIGPVEARTIRKILLRQLHL